MHLPIFLVRLTQPYTLCHSGAFTGTHRHTVIILIASINKQNEVQLQITRSELCHRDISKMMRHYSPLITCINNCFIKQVALLLHRLLLLVTLASDLLLHTIELYCILFCLAYSPTRGNLCRKQTCNVTVIHYCTDDCQLLIALTPAVIDQTAR